MFNCHCAHIHIHTTYDVCHCDDIYNIKVHATFYDNKERAFVLYLFSFIEFPSYSVGDLAEIKKAKRIFAEKTNTCAHTQIYTDDCSTFAVVRPKIG